MFDVGKRLCVLVLAGLLVSACESQKEGTFLASLNIPIFGDSESGMDETVENLEVPPDLDEPRARKGFQVPKQVQSAKNVGSGYVLPQNLQMAIRREGGVAWLEVNADPVSLWPEIERFWRDLGFGFAESNPRQGYLVTDWRRRSRSAGGYALRDRYTTRLEREPDGRTNVYIANRADRAGRFGRAGDTRDDTLVSDSEAELAMLLDLQDHLASSDLVVRAQIAPLVDERVPLRMVNLKGIPLLNVGHSYSKVWRRLAVVLQRVGMTIRDSDRARGIYVVEVGERRAMRQTQREGRARLLQIHLLAKGRETILTVHPHDRSGRMSYDVSRGILQRIVDGYYVNDRQTI